MCCSALKKAYTLLLVEFEGNRALYTLTRYKYNMMKSLLKVPLGVPIKYTPLTSNKPSSWLIQERVLLEAFGTFASLK